MKKLSTIGTAGIAALMAVCTLTGCMSKPTAPTNNESGRVEPPADIWAPYDQTVTVTTMGEENSGTEFQGDDDYGNNPWYRAYKERFNIDLQNKWISNDYGTKLNLAIADKDIADVFYVDSARLTTLYEAGLIMDLDEVFDSYASDVLKQYRKDYADTWETGCFDGKLYGMPQMNYGIIDQFQYVWIRQDWMKECGFEEPKTMDDVIKIATTFAQKYGGYALPECQTLENLFRLALSWGAHPGIWVTKDDGTIEYGTIQPEMKEALKQYTQWYKDGIVNPNFTTLNWDKMMQGMINGECGVIPFAQWFGYNPLPDLIKNQGADAIFFPYEIPTQDGSPIKGSVTFNNNGYVVIRKGCANPEAIMKIVNFYIYTVNDAVGKESNEYLSSLHSFNYPNVVRGTRIINPMNDYNQYLQVKDAFDRWQAGEDIDTSALGTNVSKYNSCVNWITSQDPNGVGDFLQQGNDRSAYGIAKKYVDNKQYVQDAKWGPDTPTLQASGSTLNDILIEGFTKIIIGEKDIDYFDELVQQWKTAGGDQATKEINDTYGNK